MFLRKPRLFCKLRALRRRHISGECRGFMATPVRGSRKSVSCALKTSSKSMASGALPSLPSRFAKNVNSERVVPVHSALEDEDFLKFAKSTKKGPLFGDLAPDRFGSRGGTGTKILSRWIRSLGVTDKRISPNHSWRHRRSVVVTGWQWIFLMP